MKETFKDVAVLSFQVFKILFQLAILVLALIGFIKVIIEAVA